VSELGDALREQARWADDHPVFCSIGLIVTPTKALRWATGERSEPEALGACEMHIKAMAHDYFFAPRKAA
jgi:hypothetical protein